MLLSDPLSEESKANQKIGTVAPDVKGVRIIVEIKEYKSDELLNR